MLQRVRSDGDYAHPGNSESRTRWKKKRTGIAMQSSSASGSNAPAALRRCPVWVWDENPLRRQTLLDALSLVQCVSPQANSSPGDFTSGSNPRGIVLSLSDGGKKS